MGKETFRTSATLMGLLEMKTKLASVAQREAKHCLEVWAKDVVNGRVVGAIPPGEIVSSEVAYLREALVGGTVERVAEEASLALRTAWHDVHGYSVDVPWVLEVREHYFDTNQHAIMITAKAPDAELT